MQHTAAVHSYTQDVVKDQARSDRDIHIMMFEFADKYLVESLIDYVSGYVSIIFIKYPWSGQKAEFVDKVFEEIPYQRIPSTEA